MAESARDDLIADVSHRLVRLGLPQEVRHTIMALVHSDAAGPARAPDAADRRVQAQVAGGLYKISHRLASALGSSSSSMVNMLLDLFVAHEQGRSVSVSSLCIASGAAPTTALRQIGQLESRGFVTRYDDERDARRSWIRPTAAAIDLVRSLIDELTAALCA